MAGLTEKQKRFVDYFIETGNKTDAARRAGYKQPEVQGSQNYDKLRSFIDEKMEEKDASRVAKQDEILEFLTSVMRDEVTEEVVVVEGIGDGCSEATKIDKNVSIKDRVKAAEQLGKRYSMWSENINLAGDFDLKVSVDYGTDSTE